MNTQTVYKATFKYESFPTFGVVSMGVTIPRTTAHITMDFGYGSSIKGEDVRETLVKRAEHILNEKIHPLELELQMHSFMMEPHLQKKFMQAVRPLLDDLYIKLEVEK